MKFWLGGLSNSLEKRQLDKTKKHPGIDPVHTIAKSFASEKMALSCQEMLLLFNREWKIGLPVSPVPEKNIEELFACFAISFHEKIIIAQTITAPKESPLFVRIYYNQYVLDKFLELLKDDA